jgi:glutamate-1-semialdehyde 2,1-aminomutase
MADLSGIDGKRARALLETENARFIAERPKSSALLQRARGSMPRGVPMSWMDDLYEHPPVWVSHGEGAHFTDVDGHRYLDLAVHLVCDAGEHGGDPHRPRDDRPREDPAVRREVPRRGRCHPGRSGGPEMRGLPGWITDQARLVPFNDVAALETALAADDVALVLAEPAMTNAGFLLPEASTTHSGA